MLKIWWFEALQELTDLTNAIAGGKVTPQDVLYRLEQLLKTGRESWPQQVAGTEPPGANPGDIWITGEAEPAFGGGLDDDF